MDIEKFRRKYFRVLDKGYVALVDVMGSDFAIDEAARTSYGEGTRKVNETNGLLRYLMRHRHSTPFEMAELKFHVKVPMDCWRQWIRHRTASVNEYSTRYSEAIDECQVTSPGEWRSQSKSNKQGSEGYITAPMSYRDINITPGEYLSVRENEFHTIARELYEERLEFGVAREQARKDLPLSNYTIAYWKVDLHNLFHFLSLRLDSHAQLEIRSYAEVIAGIVQELFPLAWKAFNDYRLDSVNFNKMEWRLLQYNSREWDETRLAEFGLSKREGEELEAKINFLNSPTKNYTVDWSKLIEV